MFYIRYNWLHYILFYYTESLCTSFSIKLLKRQYIMTGVRFASLLNTYNELLKDTMHCIVVVCMGLATLHNIHVNAINTLSLPPQLNLSLPSNIVSLRHYKSIAFAIKINDPYRPVNIILSHPVSRFQIVTNIFTSWNSDFSVSLVKRALCNDADYVW